MDHRSNDRSTLHGELLDNSPPHDVDAQRAVLAVRLLDPGRIAEVAATLEPADFGDEVNRCIYGAMLRLHSGGKPIDITLLVGELRDRGRYGAVDGISAARLVELFRLFPLVRHLHRYLDRVAKMSERRGASSN